MHKAWTTCTWYRLTWFCVSVSKNSFIPFNCVTVSYPKSNHRAIRQFTTSWFFLSYIAGSGNCFSMLLFMFPALSTRSVLCNIFYKNRFNSICNSKNGIIWIAPTTTWSLAECNPHLFVDFFVSHSKGRSPPGHSVPIVSLRRCLINIS